MSYHLFVTLPVYLLLCIGLFGVFKKAGKDAWKAFVPVLNIMVLLEIVGRPKWWLALFFIPVVNLIMGISVALDLLKSFARHDYAHHVAGVIAPFIYFIYLGFNKTDKYEGPWVESKEKSTAAKSEGREWADAILFAGTAAIIIRTFMMEAFMIPTTSMESSLMAGDFLFVSKFHYGVRMPMVPLSVPFVHNTLPFAPDTKSYLPILTLPYHRLPGLKKVERNDIVVFNYPANDIQPDNNQSFTVDIPSMKQNYIKRCVSVAGDKFEIKDGKIYIDDQLSWIPEDIQYRYAITATSPGLTEDFMEKNGFRGRSSTNQNFYIRDKANFYYEVFCSPKRAEEIKTYPYVQKVTQLVHRPGQLNENGNPLYPANLHENLPGWDPAEPKFWNLDNFGPITLPEAGSTITLSLDNIGVYRRIITAYEHHDLEIENGKFIIDGKQTDTYTFEMDYYWMMGDNRHQSSDSRYWGFVPEDHIVGRPWFVLFSWENGPRWNRFFRPITTWEDQ